jgi:hypothetical protein
MSTHIAYCDINKICTGLVSLGLPVEWIEVGNTGVIAHLTRELTEPEEELMSRVAIGQFGIFVVPEGTEVISTLSVAAE